MASFIQDLFFPSNVSTLYQYCSASTFMKMIEAKQLWLTDIKKMNDSAEEIWAGSLIDGVYKTLFPHSEQPDIPKDLFVNFYEEFLGYSRKFVSCFSEEADILSQWRAYADDGKGFSVGFSVNHLGALMEIPKMNHARDSDAVYLIKVMYSQEMQHKFIIKCIQLAIGASTSGSFDGIDTLSSLAIALKNPAFAEEKEWRLVFPLGTYDVSPYLLKNAATECLFRSSSKGISPYIPCDFEKDALVDVMLGPKNEATELDVKWFLEKHEFKNINVRKSLATYK